MKKKKLSDFRVRVIFKKNTPAADGAGGYTDSFSQHDLEIGVFETWAAVEVKSVSRNDEMSRTNMYRSYKLTMRATFGYTMDLVPKKNMLVEIVNFTTNDATVQGVIWDDWNNYFVVEATEKL